MTSTNLSFISFEPGTERFMAFLALESLATTTADPEALLEKASLLYEQSITKLCDLLSQVDRIRNSGRVIPARKIWDIGNAIFRLTKDLAKLSLQVDNLYKMPLRSLSETVDHIVKQQYNKTHKPVPYEFIVTEFGKYRQFVNPSSLITTIYSNSNLTRIGRKSFTPTAGEADSSTRRSFS